MPQRNRARRVSSSTTLADIRGRASTRAATALPGPIMATLSAKVRHRTVYLTSFHLFDHLIDRCGILITRTSILSSSIGPCVKKTARNCAPDSRYLSPVHFYRHNSEEGGAATGNAFYPNDAGWPYHFQNSYFYADYAFGGLYRVTKNAATECPYPRCDPPFPHIPPRP